MVDVQLSTLGEVISDAYWGEIADEVLVQNATDFGTPSGGVYPTSGSTVYHIRGNISFSDSLGPGIFLGNTQGKDILTYTGVGNMFEVGIGETLRLSAIAPVCATGKLLNILGDGTGFIVLQNINLVGVNDLGDIAERQFVALQDCLLTGNAAGFNFTGSGFGRFVVNGNTILNNVGTLFDLGTAVFQNISVDDNQSVVTPSGSTFMSGAAASANIGNRLFIKDNQFSGDGTILSGIDVQDLKVISKGNAALPDTKMNATGYISTPAATTSITTTPQIVAGTYTAVDENLFQVDADGRVTYLGLDEIEVSISFRSQTTTASGSNNEYLAHVGFGLSGAGSPTPITESGLRITMSNTAPAHPSFGWDVTFNTGDFVYPMVSAVAGTEPDFTAESLTVSAG